MKPTDASRPRRALEGLVAVVPAARVGRNVLADVLVRKGACVRRWPAVHGRAPRDLATMVERASAPADWLVFSGALGVEHLGDASRGAIFRAAERVAAIGIGARRALEARGVTVSASPREHTVGAVVAALGPLRGRRVTLVRSRRATSELPNRLASAGAEVRTVVGFDVQVDGGVERFAAAFEPPVDALAFGNPSAVRTFAAALGGLNVDLERCLAGVVLAAVGPATARAAVAAGLKPDLVSAGHLADLVHDLESLLRRQRS